jgi:hypothetical protein
LAGGFEGFTESRCVIRESPTEGWEVEGLFESTTGETEGSAALGCVEWRLPEGASVFSRMDDAGFRAFLRVRTSGCITGGRLAQEKKVINETKVIINHFQFFIRIIFPVTYYRKPFF